MLNQPISSYPYFYGRFIRKNTDGVSVKIRRKPQKDFTLFAVVKIMCLWGLLKISIMYLFQNVLVQHGMNIGQTCHSNG